MRSKKKLLIAISCLLALAAVQAPSAGAAFGLLPGAAGFDGTITNEDGTASTQAAAHPFAASTALAFTSTKNTVGELVPDGGSVRDIHVDLPPGLYGNPNATPVLCTYAQLAENDCPTSSQVGVTTLKFSYGFPVSNPFPIYNMVPPRGAPAAFGFRAFVVNQILTARVRTGGDYGISIEATDISQGLALLGSSFTLWGVPADPSHDAQRYCEDKPGCSTEAQRKPFITNPADCSTGPLTTTIALDSWSNPADVQRASYISHDKAVPPNPVSPTGCADVPFTPSISAQPTTAAADSPTGLSVDVHLPQNENPSGLSEATMKKAVVTLPEGMTVNPASATGLGACSEAQVELDGPNPATCPDSSKIGSVELETPLLDHPLKGSVYVARQKENPFGSLLATYIAIDDPATGVVVKLAGQIATDPRTGRVTATFDDNPQLPFEDLHVDFFGGARASLMTPATCGTYAVDGSFSSWSAADPDNPTATETVNSTSSFRITQGPDGRPCPNGQFDPKLSAGTTNPLGGLFSPFVLRLSREDGTQRLDRFDVTLPPGLLGKLAGIPYCPESALAAISTEEGTGAAQLASPSCPAASQVGTVAVGAGAGPNPLRVDTGKAYLAGPYKGAPLSLAVVTPALAGPFDLGSVVVRAALNVNPANAQITAVSDPLPTILHGIPLGLRSVAVSVDRDGFTLNPSNCDPSSFSGTAASTAGTNAPLSDRFQVAGCERLAFRPKLALSLSGQTRRTGNPALKAVLTQPEGENANIAGTTVILPKTMFIDQSHVNNPCTRVQFNAGACPAKSVLGTATAWSPLLDQPLTGPVYFRSNGGERKLPDLVADLDGQIHVTLVGFIDSVRVGKESSRVRTRFQEVPDAPVSRFVLQLKGGKRGLIENSVDLCKARQKASVKTTGQNGKTFDFEQRLGVRCKKKGAGKKGGKKRH